MINKYTYALELKSGNYIDLTIGKTLFDSGRTFTIYKWEPAHEFEKIIGVLEKNESGVPVRMIKTIRLPDTGLWLPLLRCSQKKWQFLNSPEKQKLFISKMKPSDVMLKGNLFFTDEKDFASWLGKDIYSRMMVDLL